jgi:outer membrane lipoprotein carrier protein
MIRYLLIGSLWMLSTATTVHGQSGDGADSLRRFLDDATTLRAEFRQSLYGPESAEPQVSEGVLMIKRPGRFRWEYTEPEGQLVVCDGDRVWMYDQDLAQVTVRPIDDTLRGTPAMLLSGQATLDETFEVIGSRQEDGLVWIDLRPLSGSPEFDSLRIALADGALERMELKDALGQMTVIQLFDLERNIDLDDALFVFVPPDGADVIGLGGAL